jgi:hypothetical protein
VNTVMVRHQAEAPDINNTSDNDDSESAESQDQEMEDKNNHTTGQKKINRFSIGVAFIMNLDAITSLIYMIYFFSTIKPPAWAKDKANSNGKVLYHDLYEQTPGEYSIDEGGNNLIQLATFEKIYWLTYLIHLINPLIGACHFKK